MRIAQKSKYNNDRENKVILLMITDNKKWHYFALKNKRKFDGRKQCSRSVTSLPRLLRVMTSNHHGNFYCLNCLNCSCRTENRLKKHEELFNKRDYCYPIMPNKILEYNHGEKSLKALFVIELRTECIPKKRIHVKIIQKNLTQREKLSMKLQTGQWLQNVHLMQQQIYLTITEEQIVLKSCVKN